MGALWEAGVPFLGPPGNFVDFLFETQLFFEKISVFIS